MGIIPTPSEFCDCCAGCFDPNETPKLVKLFVSGIERGGLWTTDFIMPPNGYWDLEVDEEFTCNWTGVFPGNLFIDLVSSTTQQSLIINSGPANVFGESKVDEPCGRHFKNHPADPAKSIWYGGHAHFYTPTEMADIIQGTTPMFDPDPRMECFAMDDDLVVVRYAGKRDATNINFKVDTSP